MGAKQSIIYFRDEPIIYYERPSSSPRIFSDEAGGLRYTRVYYTDAHPSDNVFKFAQALVGFTDLQHGTPGRYLRTSPRRIKVTQDTFQWRNGILTQGPIWAYATGITSVEYEGPRQQVEFEDDGGVEQHEPMEAFFPEAELAVFTVEYQTVPFVIKDDSQTIDPVTNGELDRYVSRKCQPAIQYAEQPGGYLFFEQTTTEAALSAANPAFLPYPVNTGWGFPVGMQDLTYVWHRCLFPPVSADYLLGRVNAPTDTTTYSLRPWDDHSSATNKAQCFDGRYPPGTLLLLSYSWRDYTANTGQLLYDIEYRFRFQPRGHNYTYRTDKITGESVLPGWSRVSSSGKPFTYLADLASGLHLSTYKTRLPFRHGNFRHLFMPYLDSYPPAAASTWEVI